jgi:hypothetical protein
MTSMPAFLVDPNVVADASLRLGNVPHGVEDIHERLGRHVGAAAGTPAAAAIDDLLSRFSGVLPQFALASAHLSRAVGSAARDYHASDTAVAEACERGTTRDPDPRVHDRRP